MTRRNALALAAAPLLPALDVRGAERYPRNLTKADIERWMTELSNWGRWGKEDQAGTINLITPAKRRQAAAQVKDGVAVSLSRDADIPGPAGAVPQRRYTWEHIMRSNGAGRDQGYVVDSYSVTFHGSTTTHLDAFSHYIYQGKTYNGFPGDSITSWGATKNDVMPFREGIVTRGVLVDIPVLKNLPFLGDDEAIYPEDLEAWEKKAGLRIESGDAVLVRTGLPRRLAEKGPLTPGMVPGMYASCAKWLKERDIALFGTDAAQEVRPTRIEGVNQPIHQIFLVATGTPLLDNGDFEAVSKAAQQRRRWTFQLTVAPLRVPGGTGSPVNPIAMF